MENISFDLNLFINTHPAMFAFIIIILASLVILVLMGVFFLAKTVIKKGVKSKHFEIPAEEIKKEIIQENQQIINKKETQFIECLGIVVNAAVQSGFNRSIKRQELFNKQMNATDSVFEGIISSISNEYYHRKRNNCALRQVSILLQYIFKKEVYTPLEKIFKADKLCEKTKESVIEQHRFMINGVTEKILKTTSELTIIGSEIIDEDLIEIICSKENEIKKGIIEVIEIGFDLAQEEMKGIEELQEELNKEINSALSVYLRDDYNNLNIPENWNDELPPNSIIGDSR